MIIARVRLAPGRVGYFDDLSRVHLTIRSPEASVLDTMNTTGLKRAVSVGSISLISGSLELPEVNTQPVVPEIPVVSNVEQPVAIQQAFDINAQVVTTEGHKESTPESKTAEPEKPAESEAPAESAETSDTESEKPVTEDAETDSDEAVQADANTADQDSENAADADAPAQPAARKPRAPRGSKTTSK